jgi:hypothetical protein
MFIKPQIMQISQIQRKTIAELVIVGRLEALPAGTGWKPIFRQAAALA